MEKIVENGNVAVAVSGGYGAGWSTWGKVNPMDAEFNKLFIEGKFEEAKQLAEEKGLYAGGIDDIYIEWVPEGTRFEIKGYDGSESLRIFDDTDGYVA